MNGNISSGKTSSTGRRTFGIDDILSSEEFEQVLSAVEEELELQCDGKNATGACTYWSINRICFLPNGVIDSIIALDLLI